ncbi:MAG: single-stranded DNA-binding protein [Thermosynechococcaceae cyanobacterium]
MNSCVLMAEIVKAPELRYLPDGQTAIAEMTVQFPALRAEDPMEHLKVVGWGNLAQQIQEQFHVGEQVVLEGRLTMALIDRPEGFKEKRAELTVSRIHHVQADLNAPRIASTPAAGTAAPAAPAQPKPAVPAAPTVPATPKASAPPTVPTPAPAVSKPPEIDPSSFEPDYNDIPF